MYTFEDECKLVSRYRGLKVRHSKIVVWLECGWYYLPLDETSTPNPYAINPQWNLKARISLERFEQLIDTEEIRMRKPVYVETSSALGSAQTVTGNRAGTLPELRRA